MGINFLLPIIAGIVMTIMVGTQVAPSIIDGVKSKKVEYTTINNQDIIFEATKRYLTMELSNPSINDLISKGYMSESHKKNGFGGDYVISINDAKGTLNISTTITDAKARNLFLNSLNNKNKPTCSGSVCTTTYVIPTNFKHGSSWLMNGIPAQNLEPPANAHKFWYKTFNGKAILMVSNGTTWSEVQLSDSDIVRTSLDQTINGIKTFTSSPKAPTPVTSDNSTNLATTQFVKNLINSESFTQSLTQNGWVKFPNGLIIQWGSNPTSVHNINFPIEFPNACLNVSMSFKDLEYGGVFGASYISVNNWTKKGFNFGYSDAFGHRSWIAIGY